MARSLPTIAASDGNTLSVLINADIAVFTAHNCNNPILLCTADEVNFNLKNIDPNTKAEFNVMINLEIFVFLSLIDCFRDRLANNLKSLNKLDLLFKPELFKDSFVISFRQLFMKFSFTSYFDLSA